MFKATSKNMRVGSFPLPWRAWHEIRDETPEAREACSQHVAVSWLSPAPCLRRLPADGGRHHQKPLKVVGEILGSDLRPRPNPANGSN